MTKMFNRVFDIAADTMLHCYVFEEKHNFSNGGVNVEAPDKLKTLMSD